MGILNSRSKIFGQKCIYCLPGTKCFVLGYYIADTASVSSRELSRGWSTQKGELVGVCIARAAEEIEPMSLGTCQPPTPIIQTDYIKSRQTDMSSATAHTCHTL